ncbi:CRISPR-associated endonuclease Cas2 [Acetomicrobium sp.]|uniref:CRISPR-associated endonuclease Cas2 n=1 Tax=Acetomicrobium sp. TaxID=1872099 RepID=UPI002871CCB3|nr:CRISPR-associated endonuclease Cas2 [Acetomicrobium sp.]MDR9768839.1 CRISPR-associated endonuclease Cas2 [Acetomicrobium sp.]HUM42923.1 CRISPR-associated endonuclease Cas2 [Fervidobacterium sp.]
MHKKGRATKIFVLMIYDVGEERVNKILKIGRKYLNWIQNSVLEGELTPATFESLKHEVRKVIKDDHDSVIFYIWRTEHYTSREIMGLEKGSREIFI